jgi:hypothetical protein
MDSDFKTELLMIYRQISRIDEFDKISFCMSGKDILLKIIEHKGSCDWILGIKGISGVQLCNNCPLSKLAKDKNGKYKSCYSVIVGDSLNFMHTQKEDAEEYLKMAEELLINILINEELSKEKIDDNKETNQSIC